ncbi:MAG: DUF481 domain-containing protein [Pseudomonadota bacterium]|nr:DUF481 domain-containing protein [Pseudomonadota bacterium]
MRFFALTVAACFSAVMMPAMAQEVSGNARLGYLASSGNVDETNLSAEGEIAFDFLSWRHQASASAIFSEVEDETTRERYTAGVQSDYKLSEISYLFATINFEKDRFSGIDQRFSEALGYGRTLYQTETIKLDGEIGPGARQTRYIEDDGSIRKEDELIGRGKIKFAWQISENNSFREKLLVEAGDQNTFAESVTTFRSQINKRLFVDLSYTIKHNTDVPSDRENTDRYTSLSLGYEL